MEFGGGLLLKNKYSAVHRIQGAWGSGISGRTLLQKNKYSAYHRFQRTWGNGISGRGGPVTRKGKKTYSAAHRIQGTWGNGLSEWDLLKKTFFFVFTRVKSKILLNGLYNNKC
jgi:hypothetical protein